MRRPRKHCSLTSANQPRRESSTKRYRWPGRHYPLCAPGAGLLRADRTHVWVDPARPLEVDFVLQAETLRQALLTEPGTGRDNLLLAAVAEKGTLLEGEPVAEWAVRAREKLEWSRQEARLALARDRARGFGRSSPEATWVITGGTGSYTGLQGSGNADADAENTFPWIQHNSWGNVWWTGGANTGASN